MKPWWRTTKIDPRQRVKIDWLKTQTALLSDFIDDPRDYSQGTEKRKQVVSRMVALGFYAACDYDAVPLTRMMRIAIEELKTGQILERF